MKRLASTRSERRASQPWPGRAQWRVGSIDEDGIRYGLITHCLIASTIRIAPAMVTIQSIAIRQGRGRRAVRHPPASEFRRTRVMRVLETPVELGREALLAARLLTPERAR